MNETQRRIIYEKTGGHCHFCGDKVEFEKRGWKSSDLEGYWEIDHVIQRDKGGEDSLDNYLPACTRCNRLRWHRTGAEMRELLLLGLVARDEVLRGSKVGEELVKLRDQRLERNRGRRKNP